MRMRKKRKAKTVTFLRGGPIFRSSVCLLAVLPFTLLFFSANSSSVHAAAKGPKDRKDYALIIGTVWGPDDHPVYGVRVKIRRAKDKRAKWELVSDHRGEFAQRVPPRKEDYVVWAETKDVKTNDGRPLHLVQEVQVHVDADERQDISLHLSF